jgi:hypothetical protein
VFILALFGIEKLTQAFGMKWRIFNMYGIVDRATDTMALLASKNNVLLKKQMLVLQTLVKSPKDYSTDRLNQEID